MKVAASMRSGIMRWRAPCSCSTPLHADGGGARALDLRSHLHQQRGEIDDLGLAGAVLQHGLAFGEHGRHQDVFGAGDGDLVEGVVRALELLGARLDVAVLAARSLRRAFPIP